MIHIGKRMFSESAPAQIQQTCLHGRSMAKNCPFIAKEEDDTPHSGPGSLYARFRMTYACA